MLSKNFLGESKRDASCKPFCERVRRVVRVKMFVLPSFVHRGGSSRLDALYGCVGQSADRETIRRCPRTTTDRIDHDIDIRELFDDFQASRGDSRDKFRLVRRVHIPVSVLGSKRLSVFPCIVERFPVMQDRRPESFHRGYFPWVGIVWNDRRYRNIDSPISVKDRLAMVASAGGNQPLLPESIREISD